MILKDLFLRLPEDYAIRPLADVPKNLPTFDPIYSKIVGTQDTVDVWGSRERKDVEIFGFRDTANKVIAYLIIDEYPAAENTFKLREIWVSPEHRGNSLGTGLLIFLIRKLNLKLLLASNEIVSDDARKIIKKAVNKKLFKASINKDVTLSIALNDLTKNDIEITLYERKEHYRLYGSAMVCIDGRQTFVEHSLVNVGEESIYD